MVHIYWQIHRTQHIKHFAMNVSHDAESAHTQRTRVQSYTCSARDLRRRGSRGWATGLSTAPPKKNFRSQNVSVRSGLEKPHLIDQILDPPPPVRCVQIPEQIRHNKSASAGKEDNAPHGRSDTGPEAGTAAATLRRAESRHPVWGDERPVQFSKQKRKESFIAFARRQSAAHMSFVWQPNLPVNVFTSGHEEPQSGPRRDNTLINQDNDSLPAHFTSRMYFSFLGGSGGGAEGSSPGKVFCCVPAICAEWTRRVILFWHLILQSRNLLPQPHTCLGPPDHTLDAPQPPDSRPARNQHRLSTCHSHTAACDYKHSTFMHHDVRLRPFTTSICRIRLLRLQWKLHRFPASAERQPFATQTAASHETNSTETEAKLIFSDNNVFAPEHSRENNFLRSSPPPPLRVFRSHSAVGASRHFQY